MSLCGSSLINIEPDWESEKMAIRVEDALSSLQEAAEIGANATQALSIFDDVTDKLNDRPQLMKNLKLNKEDLTVARNILQRVSEQAQKERRRLADELNRLFFRRGEPDDSGSYATSSNSGANIRSFQDLQNAWREAESDPTLRVEGGEHSSRWRKRTGELKGDGGDNAS